MVDLLNYASEAQLYFDYKVLTLANADLNSTEKGYATDDQFVAKENLNYITNPKATVIENSTATWKSGSLILLSKTTIRLKFAYDGDISNVNMRIIHGNRVSSVTEFKKVDDGIYYAYFDDFSASEYGTTMYFGLEIDGRMISNVLSYNVESYIYSKMNDDNLNTLLKSLGKYGKSAKKYITVQ